VKIALLIFVILSFFDDETPKILGSLLSILKMSFLRINLVSLAIKSLLSKLKEPLLKKYVSLSLSIFE